MSGCPSRASSWSSNPERNIQAAKAKAIQALNDRVKDPELTALERGFYEKYKQLQITGITRTGPGRYVVSGRASKASKRAGGADATGAAA